MHNAREGVRHGLVNTIPVGCGCGKRGWQHPSEKGGRRDVGIIHTVRRVPQYHMLPDVEAEEVVAEEEVEEVDVIGVDEREHGLLVLDLKQDL